MRNFLLAATALTVMTGAAAAADLPTSKGAPMAPVVYAPVFTWTGFYVGLNAGYGWNNGNRDLTFTNVTPASVDYGATYGFNGGGSDGGFVGGGQIGYNWQFGAFVAGVEADLQYADLGNSNHNGYFPYYAYYGNNNNGNYFGTVRARLGYAIDRALIYVTGGLAYGDVGGHDFWGNSSTKAGWTIGGGLEYAFTPNWTAKIEGLYVNIDRGNRSGYVTGVDSAGLAADYVVSSGKNNDFGVVRVGVNYKF
ncbi:porin family protein [Alsobacter soli]|uniref:Porin family protein n=1 Tax=Alsobacter soli TaxID=2109933 RepID=A0A2T1HUC6_9HYPH|nr:porin family protein [Alsobacter soli]